MKDQILKQDAGKLRYDLVPFEVIDEYARVFTEGLKTHPENSWKKLVAEDPGRIEAALCRHVSKHRQGEVISEDNLYHLAQIIWNAGALLWRKLQEEKVEERKKAYELHHLSIADAINSQRAAIFAEQEAQRRKLGAKKADRAPEGNAERPEVCESESAGSDEESKEHGFETERY